MNMKKSRGEMTSRGKYFSFFLLILIRFVQKFTKSFDYRVTSNRTASCFIRRKSQKIQKTKKDKSRNQKDKKILTLI